MMPIPLNDSKRSGLSRRQFMVGGLSSLSAGGVILGGCGRSTTQATLPSVATPLSPIAFDSMASFEFETVITDERGQIVRKASKKARYFTELLEPSKFLGIFEQPKVPLEMVEIPAGEFLMGSRENEPKRDRSEGPQHRVKVPRFFMGRFEVTEAQWLSLMDHDVLFPKGPNFPVGSVMWSRAQEFCRKLSTQTGRSYRLPSEAEWEYACRAGTTTAFYDGPTANRSIASNAKFAEKANKLDRYTAPVGCFPANAFGLHDLHGNAWEWEWCADDWHDDYEGAPTDGSAWVNPASQDPFHVAWHVVRGGTDTIVETETWVPSWEVRSAARTKRQLSVGSACFRVVCSA